MDPFREVTIKPDQVPTESSPIRTHYESFGCNQERLAKYFKAIQAQLDNNEVLFHENSFYLNSSDSLETLMTEDVTGLSVMTVAGSGEFSHVFIHGGASEIVSFDISPAAAFYSELRHLALCRLDMTDYIDLFYGWVNVANSRDRGVRESLLSQSVFDKLASDLSEAARQYFEELFRTPSLLNVGKDQQSFRSARRRVNSKTKHNRFIGDIITKESDYLALQEKARKVKFTQIICDATTMADHVSQIQPDLIYLSNIGFEPKDTFSIAKKYIDQGTSEVMFAISKNDYDFTNTNYDEELETTTITYQGKRLSVGDSFQFKIIDPQSRIVTLIPAIIVGIDRNADYGITIKIVKPD